MINPVVCAARSCTIYGISSSDPNSDTFTYLWNFGDGTRDQHDDVNPAHAFAADGTYTVTLTVTDAWGDCGDHDAGRHDRQAGDQRGAGPGDRRAGVRRADVHVLERRHGRPER